MEFFKLYLWMLWPPNTVGWINGEREDPVLSNVNSPYTGLIVVLFAFVIWLLAILTQIAAVISLVAVFLV